VTYGRVVLEDVVDGSRYTQQDISLLGCVS
jgi:hypothetical protein